MLVAAIEEAGNTDPEAIRAALEGLRLVTPNGEYAYGKDDHAGLGPQFISVNTVTQGAFRPTDWASTQLAELAG